MYNFVTSIILKKKLRNILSLVAQKRFLTYTNNNVLKITNNNEELLYKMKNLAFHITIPSTCAIFTYKM